VVGGDFDLVIACDDSLPHMLNDEDLSDVARSMIGRLHPGGLMVATTRDYDEMLKTRPKATTPEVYDRGERIVFQVWHWESSAALYRLN
jgi:glycine/sarcosine N-methyltransferase